MKILRRKAVVHGRHGVECRHDSQRREGCEHVGMIQRQPVAHPRTAVVSNDGETMMFQAAHQGDEGCTNTPFRPARLHGFRAAGA